MYLVLSMIVFVVSKSLLQKYGKISYYAVLLVQKFVKSHIITPKMCIFAH